MAVFVDTNVLLYAVSTVPDEDDKGAAARSILERDLQPGMNFAGVTVRNPFAAG